METTLKTKIRRIFFNFIQKLNEQILQLRSHKKADVWVSQNRLMDEWKLLHSRIVVNVAERQVRKDFRGRRKQEKTIENKMLVNSGRNPRAKWGID